LNQALPDGAPYQAGGLVNVKLLHDGGAMCGHGLEANSESLCSLLGTLAVRNQLQYLSFTAGQERAAFAGESQQVADQLRTFLAGLQCILEPETVSNLYELTSRMMSPRFNVLLSSRTA
jgi:hypothetical protein